MTDVPKLTYTALGINLPFLKKARISADPMDKPIDTAAGSVKENVGL